MLRSSGYESLVLGSERCVEEFEVLTGRNLKEVTRRRPIGWSLAVKSA